MVSVYHGIAEVQALNGGVVSESWWSVD